MEKTPNFSLDPFLKKFQIGFRFDDRFEIVAHPVRRSHCFAFKVHDHQQENEKVILLFPQQIKQDAEALAYLQEQFNLLTVLEHPNIAALFELHNSGPLAYIETEFVAGKTLKTLKLKKEQQRFNEEEVRWIFERVLEALEYAHNLNILHRDLKPANIVLTTEKKIKLIDFGLSEPIRHALNLVQDTTSSTMILYWSPEQVQGKPLTVQADIYTVGAVMYDLLNGKPPFFSGDVYNNILYKKAEPIAHCSPVMNDFLLQALAKNPEDRFKNCTEMRHALQQTGIAYFSTTVSLKDEQQTRQKLKSKPEAKQTKRRFLKPHLRYTLISALLIVFLAVLISKMQFNVKKKSVADSLRSTQTNQPADSFKIKMFKALLTEAQKKIEQKQLLQPAENNAYFLLQQAQRILPQNPTLNSLKNELRSALRQKVYQLATSGQQVQAKALLDSALNYFPNDSLLQELNKRLFAPAPLPSVLKVEILNGAGAKGIAHRLAQQLQSKQIQIVNTENYRLNGRLNWNVRHSTFKGSIPPNATIQKLEKMLGLNYQYVPAFQPQNAQATISIVLGRDYPHLKPFQK